MMGADVFERARLAARNELALERIYSALRVDSALLPENLWMDCGQALQAIKRLRDAATRVAEGKHE